MDHKNKRKTSSIHRIKHMQRILHTQQISSQWVGTLGLVDAVPKFSFFRTRSEFPILVFAKCLDCCRVILSGASENSRLMHYSSSTFHHAPPFWIWGTPPSFCIPPQSPFINLHIWDHVLKANKGCDFFGYHVYDVSTCCVFFVGRHCTDLPMEMYRLY